MMAMIRGGLLWRATFVLGLVVGHTAASAVEPDGAPTATPSAADAKAGSDDPLAARSGQQSQGRGWEPVTVGDGSIHYLPPGDAGTPAGAGQVVERPALAARLRWQLETLGWTAVPGATGGVYYLPPGSAQAAPQQATLGQTTMQHYLAEQLRQQLEEQGWESRTGTDGSTFYLPPTETAPDTTAAGPSLAEQLRRQLEARGWREIPAADGGVYYLPPNRTGPAAPESTAAATAPVGQDPAASAPTDRTPPAEDDVTRPQPSVAGEAAASSLADRLRATLEARGWVGSTGTDGSVVYRPPSVLDESVSAAGRGDGGLAGRLGSMLRAQGWGTATAEDGSTWFWPPAATEAADPDPAGLSVPGD